MPSFTRQLFHKAAIAVSCVARSRASAIVALHEWPLAEAGRWPLLISFNGSSSFRSMHAGLGEELVKSLLLLNERNGATEYLRVVVRQVNALPTFHTDKTISLRDAQQRLISLGTARWTAHRQFEDRTCVDHAEIHRSRT